MESTLLINQVLNVAVASGRLPRLYDGMKGMSHQVSVWRCVVQACIVLPTSV